MQLGPQARVGEAKLGSQVVRHEVEDVEPRCGVRTLRATVHAESRWTSKETLHRGDEVGGVSRREIL